MSIELPEMSTINIEETEKLTCRIPEETGAVRRVFPAAVW
jgi:hypothetical protein